MKGIFVQCPFKDCKKMLLKNAHLRPGTYFTTACYHCGTITTVRAEPGKIELTIDKIPDEYLTDDEDSGIVSLSL